MDNQSNSGNAANQTGNPNYRLWVLLRQVGLLMTELRREDLLKYDMSPAQVATLRSVAHLGPIATPAEISRWLMRKPHTITHLLNRMEKCGQIKKVKDMERRNQVRIALTEKGLQDYDAVKEAEYTHSLLDILDENEKETLATCLNKMRTKLLEELNLSYRPPLYDDLNAGEK